MFLAKITGSLQNLIFHNCRPVFFYKSVDIIYNFGLDKLFYNFNFQASRNSEPIRVKWFNGSDVDKFAQYQISNGDKRAYRASG